jgi:hypothetical protein
MVCVLLASENDCLHYFRPTSLNYLSQHLKMIYPERVGGLVPSYYYIQLHLQILPLVLIQRNSMQEGELNNVNVLRNKCIHIKYRNRVMLLSKNKLKRRICNSVVGDISFLQLAMLHKKLA